jgi:hypothetical protein
MKRRARRSGRPVISVLSILAVVLTVFLVVLLLWLGLRDNSEPVPAVDDGLYRDVADRVRFAVPGGWNVAFEDSATVVQHRAGTLPSYRLDVRRIEDVGLLASWNCDLLPDFLPEMARRVTPWDARLVSYRVPCHENPVEPAYVQLFLTVNDSSGRVAVFVLGPVDGVNWFVAGTEPFAGDWYPELIEAMTYTVTSVRRKD